MTSEKKKQPKPVNSHFNKSGASLKKNLQRRKSSNKITKEIKAI